MRTTVATVFRENPGKVRHQFRGEMIAGPVEGQKLRLPSQDLGQIKPPQLTRGEFMLSTARFLPTEFDPVGEQLRQDSFPSP